jgi:hypothetical protein
LIFNTMPFTTTSYDDAITQHALLHDTFAHRFEPKPVLATYADMLASMIASKHASLTNAGVREVNIPTFEQDEHTQLDDPVPSDPTQESDA